MLNKGAMLTGRNVLITAGPTFEPIDPVRYIGNRSTGKMGLALAEACLDLDALRVTVIHGPLSVPVKPDAPRLHYISVETALEMLAAVQQEFANHDLIICAAAVSDFRPAEYVTGKIKKEEGAEGLLLQLVKNPDIAKWCGENKTKSQYVIGFSLETDNEEGNALLKLQKKSLDMIVLNSLRVKGAGFSHDTNEVSLYYSDGKREALPLQSKREIARGILQHTCQFLQEKTGTL